VVEHDQQNGGDWVGFVGTLIQANFALAGTATQTGLHINTVKYRCARLQELMSRDFRNAHDRLEIQLAYELHATRGSLERARGGT
jgi:sugar diacid utilization regulator